MGLAQNLKRRAEQDRQQSPRCLIDCVRRMEDVVNCFVNQSPQWIIQESEWKNRKSQPVILRQQPYRKDKKLKNIGKEVNCCKNSIERRGYGMNRRPNRPAARILSNGH